MKSNGIIIKDQNQIENIRESGKYLTELLSLVNDAIKPGVTLMELENIAVDYLGKHNLKGAFNGYYGFPANLCLSVNDCVVHGIPNNYELKNGDLLKVDAGVVYKGGITDSAISVVVGGEETSKKGSDLVKATKEGIDENIKSIGPGKLIFDYSFGIHKFLKNKGFSVIKNLTGHGVGQEVHEKPHIFNWPHKDTKKIEFKENMVVAIEPITALRSDDVIEKPGDNWSLYTKYGDYGAQREYTILITSNGYEILSGLQ